tara:strand:- start:44991 stop:45554 length:564 start_codon:yes stop_codon:yes gene_type:complete
MACNCNKCKPSKNCGCNDSSLATPCTYSDCSVGSERCKDVQCAECVSYCGTTFEVGTTNNLIKIETGERLDSIVQKFALILSQGLGSCTSDDLHHAPYNLFATNISKTSALIQWNNVSTNTQTFSVQYYKTSVGLPWLNAASSLVNTTLSYSLTTLVAASQYKVRVVSTDSSAATCQSVSIIFDTLA